jgi:hypothetical protein
MKMPSSVNIYRNYVREVGRINTLRRLTEEVCIRLPFIKRLYWRHIPEIYSTIYEHDKRINNNPYKRIYVDPKDIKQYSKIEYESWRIPYQIGSVLEGEWDLEKSDPIYPYMPGEKIKSNSVNDHLYPAMYEVFKNKKKWSETQLYSTVLKRIREGDKPWHNCENKKDLDERCENVNELYEKIWKFGYKSQINLNESHTFLQSLGREVLIDMDRNGNPLFVNGIHRLTISRLIGLDEIPVVVVTRHAESLDQ